MKQVFLYHRKDDDWYDITNKEFEDMMNAWEDKKNYWCPRIEVLFKEGSVSEVRTSQDEVGKRVLIDPSEEERFDTRCYEVDGKYYKIGHPAIYENQILSTEKIKRLVPIDDYYNNQLQDTFIASEKEKVKLPPE